MNSMSLLITVNPNFKNKQVDPINFHFSSSEEFFQTRSDMLKFTVQSKSENF